MLIGERCCRVGQAIKLAYEAQIQSILPTAFYALQCLYRTSFLLRVTEPPDSEDASLVASATLEKLPPSCLRQFFDGREILAGFLDGILGSISVQLAESYGCTAQYVGRGICTPALTLWFASAHLDHVQSGLMAKNPLCALREMRVAVSSTRNPDTSFMCRNCKIHMCQLIEAARLALWDRIPSAFALSPGPPSDTFDEHL